jgi:hypothetical protein
MARSGATSSELDVNRFLDEERRLTERFSAEQVVDACLLMHHFEALHLSDPPVLLHRCASRCGPPRRSRRSIGRGPAGTTNTRSILNPKRRERASRKVVRQREQQVAQDSGRGQQGDRRGHRDSARQA